jgi:hypothetical protein
MESIKKKNEQAETHKQWKVGELLGQLQELVERCLNHSSNRKQMQRLSLCLVMVQEGLQNHKITLNETRAIVNQCEQHIKMPTNGSIYLPRIYQQEKKALNDLKDELNSISDNHETSHTLTRIDTGLDQALFDSKLRILNVMQQLTALQLKLFTANQPKYRELSALNKTINQHCQYLKKRDKSGHDDLSRIQTYISKALMIFAQHTSMYACCHTPYSYQVCSPLLQRLLDENEENIRQAEQLHTNKYAVKSLLKRSQQAQTRHQTISNGHRHGK